MDILILGATSNICKKRVFDNLNNLHHKINTIYCYDMKKMKTLRFDQYVMNDVTINNENNIVKKIKYIYGNFNVEEYSKKIKSLLHKFLIIYVSVPPFCYEEIIMFFKENNNYHTLILEKPLALNYEEYLNLKPNFTENMYVIDHFLYKQDIQKIINSYQYRKINTIKIKFWYENDVEDRLGYFDNVGFFIDMFQSHYLSILYHLIGIDKLSKLLNMEIKVNTRKQYKNYGGMNKVDTYFYVELKDDTNLYIFEGGKAMVEENKEIEIDGIVYKINNYNNEYELYFKNILENNMNKSMIKYHDLFWKITDYINNDMKMNLNIDYYDKNNNI